MSTTFEALERSRHSLRELIELAAQEALKRREDGDPYRAGRQAMRDDVATLLRHRAAELGAARQGREAGAVLQAAAMIEALP